MFLPSIIQIEDIFQKNKAFYILLYLMTIGRFRVLSPKLTYLEKPSRTLKHSLESTSRNEVPPLDGALLSYLRALYKQFKHFPLLLCRVETYR